LSINAQKKAQEVAEALGMKEDVQDHVDRILALKERIEQRAD
jgi:hypothetical protein